MAADVLELLRVAGVEAGRCRRPVHLERKLTLTPNVHGAPHHDDSPATVCALRGKEPEGFGNCRLCRTQAGTLPACRERPAGVDAAAVAAGQGRRAASSNDAAPAPDAMARTTRR